MELKARVRKVRDTVIPRRRFPESGEQASQRALMVAYRELARRDPAALPTIADAYLRAYSQNGEDGALLLIFAAIGSESRVVIEICAGDGIECNAANLIVNHGWDGFLVDGDEQLVERGRAFYGSCPDTRVCPPELRQAWVTAENVNDLVAQAGFGADIDLLSLDLDGVDYWIWKALDAVRPRVVVCEYQDIWGAEDAVTVPYRPDFTSSTTDNDYQGASLHAFVKLGREKGYRLVGVERLGFNAFFVRDDVGTDVLPEIDHRSCFSHRKVREGMRDRLPRVAGREWIRV